MRHKNLGQVFILCVLVLVSCSQKELPYFGVFLQDKSDFLQMLEFEGPPNLSESGKIPVTDNSQPVILVWHPDIDLRYLELQSDAGDGDNVEYNVAPSQQEGVLEITPQSTLPSDIYCLVQGDPLGAPYGLLHWCFEISTTMGESNPEDISQSDLAVIDPSNVHLIQPLTIQEKGLIFNNTVNFFGSENSAWHEDPDELRVCRGDILRYNLDELLLESTIELSGRCILITKDGNIAVIVAEDNQELILYDIDSEENKYQFSIEDPFNSVELFPGGRLLLSAGESRTYIEIESGEIFFQESMIWTNETKPRSPIRTCGTLFFMNSENYGAISDFGKGDVDMVISICDLKNQIMLHEIQVETGFAELIGFSPDDKLLYYTVSASQEGSNSYEVYVASIDVDTGRQTKLSNLPTERSFSGYRGAISPDGKLLFVGYMIIDAHNGQLLHQLPDHMNIISASPDGRFIMANQAIYGIIEN